LWDYLVGAVGFAGTVGSAAIAAVCFAFAACFSVEVFAAASSVLRVASADLRASCRAVNHGKIIEGVSPCKPERLYVFYLDLNKIDPTIRGDSK